MNLVEIQERDKISKQEVYDILINLKMEDMIDVVAECLSDTIGQLGLNQLNDLSDVFVAKLIEYDTQKKEKS